MNTTTRRRRWNTNYPTVTYPYRVADQQYRRRYHLQITAHAADRYGWRLSSYQHAQEIEHATGTADTISGAFGAAERSTP